MLTQVCMAFTHKQQAKKSRHTTQRYTKSCIINMIPLSRNKNSFYQTKTKKKQKTKGIPSNKFFPRT